MTCCCDVGSFIYHSIYGYGEITTVSEDGKRVFIDFLKGHCDWFSIYALQKASDVYPAEKAFIRHQYKKGETLKGIIELYKGSGYRFIEILV